MFEAPLQEDASDGQHPQQSQQPQHDQYMMQSQAPVHSLRRDGWRGFLWKASRVGERCSEYVAVSMVILSVYLLLF